MEGKKKKVESASKLWFHLSRWNDCFKAGLDLGHGWWERLYFFLLPFIPLPFYSSSLFVQLFGL